MWPSVAPPDLVSAHDQPAVRGLGLQLWSHAALERRKFQPVSIVQSAGASVRNRFARVLARSQQVPKVPKAHDAMVCLARCTLDRECECIA